MFLYLLEEILFFYLVQSFQNGHSGEHWLHRVKQKEEILSRQELKHNWLEELYHPTYLKSSKASLSAHDIGL